MKTPRIGIVGAGPGGLTLARILHRHGVEAPVFEREMDSKARSQGGSLDLHAETGQFAIQCAGLGKKFKRIARYEDQESRIYDKHGTLVFEDADTEDGNRPEVDRGQLRQMLLDSLPPEVVHWNHKAVAAQLQGDGTCELIFESGERESFDLVVGADGAWSRLRPLLSDAQPIYSGVTFFEIGIDDVDKRHPETADLVGHGLTFVLGDNKALICHRDIDARIGIYAALRVPEDWLRTEGLDTVSPEELKAALTGHFRDWSDGLKQLIAQSGSSVTPRRIYALPTGQQWEHRLGVTLIGDAAHLMSPFTGEGANLAMRDAADLAQALVAGSDWNEAVRSMEAEMFSRAEVSAASAKEGIEGAFSDTGLDYMLEQMQGHRN